MCNQQPNSSNKACASFQPSKWLPQSIVLLLAIIGKHWLLFPSKWLLQCISPLAIIGKHGLLLSWLLDFSNNSIKIDVSLFVETLLNHGPPLWFWDYQKNLLTRKCVQVCHFTTYCPIQQKFSNLEWFFVSRNQLEKINGFFPRTLKLISLQLK